MAMRSQCAGQVSTSSVGVASALQNNDYLLSSGSRSTSTATIKMPENGGGQALGDFLQVESTRLPGDCGRGRAAVQRQGGGAAGAIPESEAETSFTYAYYVVTSDGDDYMAPNVFIIPKRSTCVTLRDVKEFFPLPGTYHFRFKVRVAEEPEHPREESGIDKHSARQEPFVWLDILEDRRLLPLYDSGIHIKATRLSWQQESPGIEAAAITQGSTKDTEAAFTLEDNGSGRKATSVRQRRHASPTPVQQQDHSAAGRVSHTSRVQLLPTRECEGSPVAAAPACSASSFQQYQTQQSSRWETGEKKPYSAASAMLLFDEDLPSSREAHELPLTAGKGQSPVWLVDASELGELHVRFSMSFP